MSSGGCSAETLPSLCSARWSPERCCVGRSWSRRAPGPRVSSRPMRYSRDGPARLGRAAHAVVLWGASACIFALVDVSQSGRGHPSEQVDIDCEGLDGLTFGPAEPWSVVSEDFVA